MLLFMIFGPTLTQIHVYGQCRNDTFVIIIHNILAMLFSLPLFIQYILEDILLIFGVGAKINWSLNRNRDRTRIKTGKTRTQFLSEYRFYTPMSEPICNRTEPIRSLLSLDTSS